MLTLYFGPVYPNSSQIYLTVFLFFPTFMSFYKCMAHWVYMTTYILVGRRLSPGACHPARYYLPKERQLTPLAAVKCSLLLWDGGSRAPPPSMLECRLARSCAGTYSCHEFMSAVSHCPEDTVFCFCPPASGSYILSALSLCSGPWTLGRVWHGCPFYGWACHRCLLCTLTSCELLY